MTLSCETTLGYVNDYTNVSSSCSTNPAPGPDHAYEVVVADGQRLAATVRPNGWDVGVDLIMGPASACSVSPRVCLGSRDSAGAGAAETASWVNETGAAKNVFVLVDSFAQGAAGTYSLDVELLTPAMGDLCSRPDSLNAGQTLTAQSLDTMYDDYRASASCAGPADGRDRVYSVSIPKDKRAIFTVSPSPGVNTSISLVASTQACSTRICTASESTGGPGATDSLVWVNNTDAGFTGLVVIDSDTNALDAGFTIGLVVDNPPTVGDVCASPEALPNDGGVVSGSTFGYANNYSGAGTGCATQSGGPDRVYTTSIPPGLELAVTLTPDAGFTNTSLSILDSPAASCAARVCLASGGTTVRRLNAGTSAQNVFVIVDSAGNPGGSYNLSATVGPPQGGDTCVSATPVASSTTFTNQSTSGFNNDYSPASSCTGYSEPGNDQVYILTLPAFGTLNATLTPITSTDVSIYVLSTPASNCTATPATCLAGKDSAGSGQAETLAYTNPFNMPLDVFVIVDAYTAGAFDYNLTLAF